MGGAVFPLPCLTWDQTMVKVMKIMVTSFQRSYARTATLSVPNPVAGQLQPMSLPETHGLASLGQSLVGSLLLCPGSWCKQCSVCALQECVSPVLGKSGGSGGLMVTPSKSAYATPRSAAPRAPAPAADHCWPVPLQETLKHSKAGLALSLWGLLVCTRFCLSPLSISGRYGVWF